MTKPKVAVITRTKDRAILLERAILSVHNQTMTDFVHVIINDAGSPAVVDDLVEKHKKLIGGRVKVIHNKTSNGMEAASNKAIKSVESYFIAIHDDDDTWHQDFLKCATSYLENTGDMGVVVTTDKVDEEITNKDTVRELSRERWLPDTRVINLYKQCLDNYATPITFLYRRKVYEEIGYYNEDLPVAGDWDFALRFLMKYDIAFLPTDEALAYYHHRVGATGVNQNSVFVDKGLLHEQKINMLANHYLREELKSGKLGTGYLMSQMRHEQDLSDRYFKRVKSLLLENVIRLEGHINLTSDESVDRTVHAILSRFSAKNLVRNTVKNMKWKKS